MRQWSLIVILNPWVKQGSSDVMEELCSAHSVTAALKYGSSVNCPTVICIETCVVLFVAAKGDGPSPSLPLA